MKRIFPILLLATALHAQQFPTTPPEQMKTLDPLVGTWTVTARPTTPNAPPQPSTTVTFTRDLKGRFVRMDGTFNLSPDHPPINIRGYYSFDRFQNVYRLAVLDDAAGLLDVYEGTMRHNAITVTNLRTGTFFGRDRIFGAIRFLNFSANAFDVELDGSNDEGRSWNTTNRIHFERVR